MDCFINGFFYSCGRTEISLQIASLGMVAIGSQTVTVPIDDGAFFGGQRGDIKDVLGYTSIRPVQLTLERLSTGDILSAVI